MIGHYLLTLTPEQEDRVLTMQFGDPDSDESRCLVMVAEPHLQWLGAFRHLGLGDEMSKENYYSPARRYDNLCFRFGLQRTNTAIRNRILANQARRTLTPVRGRATV